MRFLHVAMAIFIGFSFKQGASRVPKIYAFLSENRALKLRHIDMVNHPHDDFSLRQIFPGQGSTSFWDLSWPVTTNTSCSNKQPTKTKASRLASGRTDSTSKSGSCGWPDSPWMEKLTPQC